MKKFLLLMALCVLCVLNGSRADAQNLITGGDFEVPGGDIPNWDIEEYYTNDTSAAPDSASVATFVDKAQTPPKSFWLKPFAGTTPTGNANRWLTNAILSQTLSATAGTQYTFSGWSLFEANYSGGVA